MKFTERKMAITTINTFPKLFLKLNTGRIIKFILPLNLSYLACDQYKYLYQIQLNTFDEYDFSLNTNKSEIERIINKIIYKTFKDSDKSRSKPPLCNCVLPSEIDLYKGRTFYGCCYPRYVLTSVLLIFIN
jgi:hypothetical protein